MLGFAWQQGFADVAPVSARMTGAEAPVSRTGQDVVTPNEHALVILEDGAVPFCHYENPHFHAAAEPRWMAPGLLAGIIRRARKDKIALTFLLGKTAPPPKLQHLIDTVDHAKIVPWELHGRYPDAVVVLDAKDSISFAELTNNLDRNLILRLGKRSLKKCSGLVEALFGKFRRLSIHLVDVEDFTSSDFVSYEKELRKMRAALVPFYRDGYPVEVNVLTDRMMLSAMRNCGAGVDHLTIAPDGKCYLCPAFYYDDERSSVGAFDDKKGLVVRRLAAAQFVRAPLCTRCDAFHCKRCIFLNKKTTLELNVPSEQQCAVAHLEREASRQMLIDLGSTEPFRRMPRITELNYRDPLECIDAPPLGVQLRATDPSTDPML
ncbi:MAG: CXXX repeat peptide maturase [Alphaproteobacteria bacterium]|nr:CXXX repeat peptide maturase [Alphaproteobacteria bacterium]